MGFRAIPPLQSNFLPAKAWDVFADAAPEDSGFWLGLAGEKGASFKPRKGGGGERRSRFHGAHGNASDSLIPVAVKFATLTSTDVREMQDPGFRITKYCISGHFAVGFGVGCRFRPLISFPSFL